MVSIPPHFMPALREHAEGLSGDHLLFPGTAGGNLTHSQVYKPFRRARDAAGHPSLRIHDLRHTGSMLALDAGASQSELMGRLGHTTAKASQMYQHVRERRDALIAQRPSDLA